jgi:hypothetical protein
MKDDLRWFTTVYAPGGEFACKAYGMEEAITIINSAISTRLSTPGTFTCTVREAPEDLVDWLYAEYYKSTPNGYKNAGGWALYGKDGVVFVPVLGAAGITILERPLDNQ